MKLIALDMDGTLLLDDHKSMTERAAQALREASKRGLEIVPATGRVQSMLPKGLSSLGLVRYAVTSNGAAVRDLQTGRLIFGDMLAPDAVRRILDGVRPYDLFCQLYCDGNMYVEEKNLDRVGQIPFHPAFVAEIRRCIRAVGSFEELMEAHPEGIEKVNFPHVAPGLRERIWERFAALGGLSLTSALSGNMEINAEGCNKGKALANLCAELGMDASQVMAFGDNGNDLEMLAFAGASFAMRNGTEDAKKAARYAADSNEEDGVAKAIESMLLRRQAQT